MIKELRDLVSFILGFGGDLIAVVGNSALLSSPTAKLGADKAKALNLSAVVAIILLSVFIKTLSSVKIQIDLLLFSIVCIGYFMISALTLSCILRVIMARDHSVGENADPDIDSHTFVLGFNILALLVFTIARELAVFLGYRSAIGSINLIGALFACVTTIAIFVLIGRLPRGKDSSIFSLTQGQQYLLISVQSALFLLYTLLITR